MMAFLSLDNLINYLRLTILSCMFIVAVDGPIFCPFLVKVVSI